MRRRRRWGVEHLKGVEWSRQVAHNISKGVSEGSYTYGIFERMTPCTGKSCGVKNGYWGLGLDGLDARIKELMKQFIV